MLTELSDLLPFTFAIDRVVVAGAALWALTLYLALSSLSDWVTAQLTRWFNFAERSLYFSEEEFERTREGRESQNAFWASMFSVIPFIAVGILLHYGVERGLGPGWSISLGLIFAVSSGIYELGRRSSETPDA